MTIEQIEDVIITVVALKLIYSGQELTLKRGRVVAATIRGLLTDQVILGDEGNSTDALLYLLDHRTTIQVTESTLSIYSQDGKRAAMIQIPGRN